MKTSSPSFVVATQQTLTIRRGRSLLLLDCEIAMDKAQLGESSGYNKMYDQRQALMNAIQAEETAFVAVTGVTPSSPLPTARAVKAWAKALAAREAAEVALDGTVGSVLGWWGIERTA